MEAKSIRATKHFNAQKHKRLNYLIPNINKPDATNELAQITMPYLLNLKGHYIDKHKGYDEQIHNAVFDSFVKCLDVAKAEPMDWQSFQQLLLSKISYSIEKTIKGEINKAAALTENKTLIRETLQPNIITPVEHIMVEELFQIVENARQSTLNKQEQTIIDARFKQGKTFEESGHLIGLTGTRAQQIERQALRKLRLELYEKDDLDAVLNAGEISNLKEQNNPKNMAAVTPPKKEYVFAIDHQITRTYNSYKLGGHSWSRDNGRLRPQIKIAHVEKKADLLEPPNTIQVTINSISVTETEKIKTMLKKRLGKDWVERVKKVGDNEMNSILGL